MTGVLGKFFTSDIHFPRRFNAQTHPTTSDTQNGNDDLSVNHQSLPFLSTCVSKYQPGKMPLVLIHGLYSDPLSWADLVNDMHGAPGFAEKYQIWLYRYTTGQGVLQSAAALRTELQAAIAQCDPELRDARCARPS